MSSGLMGHLAGMQYFQVFHMNFKINIRHLVLLEMIFFRKYLHL